MFKYNLLVADRDIRHLNTVFSFFEKREIYNVMNATSGEMALWIAKKKRLDLFLLDWETITASEIDFFKHLKSQSRGTATPFLILAENQQIDKDRQFFQNNEISFLHKPVQENELIKHIEQILPAENIIHQQRKLQIGLKHNDKKSLIELKSVLLNQFEKLKTDKENFRKLKTELKKTQESLIKEKNALLLELNLFEAEKKELENQQRIFTAQENDFFFNQIQLEKREKNIENKLYALENEKVAFSASKKIFKVEKKAFLKEKEQFLGKFSMLKTIVDKRKNNEETGLTQSPYQQILDYVLPDKINMQIKNAKYYQIKFYPEITLLSLGIKFGNLSSNQAALVHQILEKIEDVCLKCQLRRVMIHKEQHLLLSGIQRNNSHNPRKVVEAALEILSLAYNKPDFQLYLSVQSGAILTGTIEQKYFVFDIWDEMIPDTTYHPFNKENILLISENTYQLLDNAFDCKLVDKINSKKSGEKMVYQLVGIHSPQE